MESELKHMSEIDMSLNLFRYKLVFVGDVGVGKTSIINRFMENKFNETYDPSIGVDFFSKTLKFRNKSLKLQVWDSAGQEKYRSLIPNYIKNASLIFIVYDISKYESFLSIQFWLDFVKDNGNPLIVLLGNKTDLAGGRKVTIKEALDLAHKENISMFEISAKTGENMKHMVYSAVALLPFFESFNLEFPKIVTELEVENSHREGKNNNSFIDSSRGAIQIHRSEIVSRRDPCNRC